MPLSRPRSFLSARFRNMGMLKISLGKLFLVHKVMSLQLYKKCLTTKKSLNLKRIKEIDMKNIFIL